MSNQEIIENRAANLTLEDLFRIEPGLKILFSDCHSYRGVAGQSCVLNDWYSSFKPVLVKLVGFGAVKNNSLLRSSRAYNKAYEACFNAMKCPVGCRGCEK